MKNYSSGLTLLPYQAIKDLAEKKLIKGAGNGGPIQERQLGPCSLDLRLGNKALRIRASFLGSHHTNWQELCNHFSMHEMNLTDQGAVLEKGCVYLIPIQEEMNLPDDICGWANSRSTAGRLGIFTRLIVSHHQQSGQAAIRPDGSSRMLNFDEVPCGCRGRLYLEICPTCFSIRVKQGDSLNHLRFFKIEQGKRSATLPKTPLYLDLLAKKDEPVGFQARSHTGLVDFSTNNQYPAKSFWQPVYAEKGGIILSPGDFYILRTKNQVSIGSNQAGYLRSYHAPVGEFRLHYAAYLDAGFGEHCDTSDGARVILEVKGNEVPFFLEDGQIAGYLQKEELAETTAKPYGYGNPQAYRNCGLQLARQFKPWT